MKFDSICRCLLIDVAKKYGIDIAEEPIYGGREYLEKQDYIRQKLNADIIEQSIKLKKKESELEEITLKISDAEKFADDVAEAAYEKAVEVVTEKVREETRNEDFALIEEYGSSIINNPKNSEPVRKILKNLFTGLLQRFRGMTERINEKLAKVFSDPAKQEEIKKPVKESVIARLNAKKQTIADDNAHRQKSKTQGKDM